MHPEILATEAGKVTLWYLQKGSYIRSRPPTYHRSGRMPAVGEGSAKADFRQSASSRQ